MEHAARALDLLWRSFPPELLLYNESDTRDLVFETSLQQSGLLPCILVNIGSAMTIVMVRMFRLFLYRAYYEFTLNQIDAALHDK